MRFLVTLTCLVLGFGTLKLSVGERPNNHATPEMIRAYEAAQRNI